MNVPRGYGRKNIAEKERVQKVRGEYEALKQMFSDLTTHPLSSKIDVLKVTYSVFCEVLGMEPIHVQEVQEEEISQNTTENDGSEQVSDDLRASQRPAANIQESAPQFMLNSREQTTSETLMYESEMDHQSQPAINTGQVPVYVHNDDGSNFMAHASAEPETISNSTYFRQEWHGIDGEENGAEENDTNDSEQEDYGAVSDTFEEYKPFPTQTENQFPHNFQQPSFCHPFPPPLPPFSHLNHIYSARSEHHDPPPFMLPCRTAHTPWAFNSRFPHFPSQHPHIAPPYPLSLPNLAPPYPGPNVPGHPSGYSFPSCRHNSSSSLR